MHVSCNASTTNGLDELLTRFWECEEIESNINHSPEEKRCEEMFASSDGRYIVSLPKQADGTTRLGDSRGIAYRRLLGTERRLAKDDDLQQQYVSFMEEYLRLGHIQRVDATNEDTTKRCFLPHHPVIKEASTTTKVRVVFDASYKTSSGVSLNDILLTGPIIQDDLRSIVLRCRTRQIMLVADVEKMFRQIVVHQEERPLQTILWRAYPKEEVGTYELNTVTYGTKPAPFLATRVLKQLSIDEEVNYPVAAKAVAEDTYMDDVLTGSDTIIEATNLRMQLEKLMESGGFRLRKWASNSADVLDGIPQENLAIQDSMGVTLDPDPVIKTLGLVWQPVSDVFGFNFNIPPLNGTEMLSRRQLLSIIATLFDPLGLVGATITMAKLFMQLSWTLMGKDDQRIGWDEPLPSTVGEAWRKYHQQLPLLNQIHVKRCVIIAEAVSVEIHCFSDASQKAYGACLYIRSRNMEGRVNVQLFMAKSKVASLKTVTIPRLELCGARLAAQLYQQIQRATRLAVSTYFWTDSTCVLRWLEATPSTWTTFVANRVATVQSLTEGCQWRHVPGNNNPADLISRGVLPEELINNDFWWHGPSWLQHESMEWPNSSELTVSSEIDEERRRVVVALVTTVENEFYDWYIAGCSSYTILLRKTALCLRFIDTFCRTRKEKRTGWLTTHELRTAESIIIQRIQQQTFAEEYKALLKGDTVSMRSPLRWFKPFISKKDNLLRVGGRLVHSEESEDTKHPIVLPARHGLTRLILLHYHHQLLHAGPQLLLSAVRLRYWPLGGRNLAKQIVHRCHKCFRSKPTPAQQLMGDLPAARVTISRPFSRTGVDFFGPIYLRPVPRRSAVKAYAAIFVCFCTKAVHLELVGDLSTERFLQALRRFIARRGKPSDIYSDNGTNFVGAWNKLRELRSLLTDNQHRERVNRACSEEGIRWHFSPPSGPHFGGLWEAAVRSAKYHIVRVIGNCIVSPEDMNTLLIQVEGCLNSRPITAISDDPTDLAPLTPSHFLTGSSLQTLPELDLQNVPMNRLKQWQLMQRMLQDFWRRWQREYLSQLQGRMKRWRPPIQIDIGRLVVIRDENLPPLHWKMGRILRVHPGPDGIVRVVDLKTETGSLTRPVEKLCLLPLPEDNESPA